MNRLLPFVFVLTCLSSMLRAETPPEAGIRVAEAQIAKSPGTYQYYNDLALAFARRAQETCDARYYRKADEALARSLAIAPDNLAGLKVRARVLLGQHEFAKAVDLATRLNKQTPDDIVIYGYLAEANEELGNYKEAATAAQWMLRIRPGNAAGLAVAGELREVLGYIAPAMEVTRMAYDLTPGQETETRSDLLVRMARLNLLAGDVPKAETYATTALDVFPGYPAGLAALAEVRTAQQRYDEAVTLQRKRYEEAPRAAHLYALGEALMRAGQKAEANAVFAEFEKRALAESDDADNANRELIVWYIDFANRPADALRIAEKEIARRHDVFTIDSYAWALAATGDLPRASIEIRKAVGTGVKDPQILQHAAAIARRLGTTAQDMGELFGGQGK
jgi:tetratricopeptide (TPR) repeat protein